MEADLTSAALLALRKILLAAEIETRKMTASIGLAPSQVLILRQIASRDAVTPSALASAVWLGQATITNIVDRLVSGGLVTRSRSEHDKRQVILRITEAGREKLKTSPLPLQLRISEAFSELPTWEQAMILASLERLGSLLDGDDAAGSPPK